nr:Protein of unknown function DUF148 domain containing protein [Haemonchus contortus]
MVLCRHYEKRGRFRFRGPPIPPPPPYLREVNGTARLEYFDIMRNMSLTIAQQKKDVQAWAAKYDITEYRVIEFTFDQFLPKCGCGGEPGGRGRGRGLPPNSLSRWDLPKNGISGYDFVVESLDRMENGDEIEIIVPVSPSIEGLDWKGKASHSEEDLDAREIAE